MDWDRSLWGPCITALDRRTEIKPPGTSAEGTTWATATRAATGCTIGMLYKRSRLQVETPNLLSCKRHPCHPQVGNLIRNSSTGLLCYHLVFINAQAKLYHVGDASGVGLGILKQEARGEAVQFQIAAPPGPWPAMPFMPASCLLLQGLHEGVVRAVSRCFLAII